MSGSDRVVWSEGMFLRTQHFPAAGPLGRSLRPGRRRGPCRRRLGLSSSSSSTPACSPPVRSGWPRPRGGCPTARRSRSRTAPIIRRALQTAETTRDGIVYLCLPALQPGAAEVDADGAARLRGPAARTVLEIRDLDRDHGRSGRHPGRPTGVQPAPRERGSRRSDRHRRRAGSRVARPEVLSCSRPTTFRPACATTCIRRCRISWPSSRASSRASPRHASATS